MDLLKQKVVMSPKASSLRFLPHIYIEKTSQPLCKKTTTRTYKQKPPDRAPPTTTLNTVKAADVLRANIVRAF